MGPGSDGPMGGLGGMESHHMNGSLGKDIKSDVQKWIQKKTLILHSEYHDLQSSFYRNSFWNASAFIYNW